jgi:preflagellin peptidase FlaK
MPPVHVTVLAGVLGLLLAGPALTDLLYRRVDRRWWPPVTVMAVLLSAAHLGWLSGVAPRLARSIALLQLLLAMLLGAAGLWAHRQRWLGGADWKLIGLLPLCLPPGLVLLPSAAPWPPAVVPPLSALALASLLAVTQQLGRWATSGGGWLRPMQVHVPTARLLRQHGQVAAGPHPGLDLDTLRMYLRWRRTTLTGLRTQTTDPAAGCDIHLVRPPLDGAVMTAATTAARLLRVPAGDRWGAATFLAAAPRDGYGATVPQLRGTLDWLMLADGVQIRVGQPLVTQLYVVGCVILALGDPITAVVRAMG